MIQYCIDYSYEYTYYKPVSYGKYQEMPYDSHYPLLNYPTKY